MFFRNKKIASFEILTLRLSGMRRVCEYEIVCEGETSAITEYGVLFGEGKDTRVPEKTAACPTADVLRVLNACRVLGWDGFYGKHPRNVKDGTAFRLTARVNGGEIAANGSQNFPRRFHDLREFIESRLRESPSADD